MAGFGDDYLDFMRSHAARASMFGMEDMQSEPKVSRIRNINHEAVDMNVFEKKYKSMSINDKHANLLSFMISNEHVVMIKGRLYAVTEMIYEMGDTMAPNTFLDKLWEDRHNFREEPDRERDFDPIAGWRPTFGLNDEDVDMQRRFSAAIENRKSMRHQKLSDFADIQADFDFGKIDIKVGKLLPWQQNAIDTIMARMQSGMLGVELNDTLLQKLKNTTIDDINNGNF